MNVWRGLFIWMFQVASSYECSRWPIDIKRGLSMWREACLYKSRPIYIRLMYLYGKLSKLQHTATHCNTLQHTATHCNTLQHTATHCMYLYGKLSKSNLVNRCQKRPHIYISTCRYIYVWVHTYRHKYICFNVYIYMYIYIHS